MEQVLFDRPARRARPGRLVWLAVLAVAVLFVLREGSALALEYAWWKELGQLETWLGLFTYAYAPLTVATLAAFAVLWFTHWRAMHFSGVGIPAHRNYVWLASIGLLLLAWLVAASSLENWTIVRYFGSRNIVDAPGAFHDPVFHLPLKFYLFDLPFYSALRNYLLSLAIVCALLFWIAARVWQLRFRFTELRDVREIDLSFLRLPGGLESRFLRGVLAIVLLALACRYFLGRYEMVWHEHGFMAGIDWLEDHVTLPLQWALVLGCVAAAVFASFGRWRLVLAMAVLLPISWLVPTLTSALYVKPNEISLEAPYIDAHIHATRSAYGIENRVTAVEYKTDSAAGSLDVVKHHDLLDNVRLWDWRAFHDTVTQSQALRHLLCVHDAHRRGPLHDRRPIPPGTTGPGELDITQLPDDRASWINPHFIYTHGYGLALAEVSKITPEGLPVYLVENMPPEIKTPSLKIVAAGDLLRRDHA